jgi:hypothetical protein
MNAMSAHSINALEGEAVAVGVSPVSSHHVKTGRAHRLQIRLRELNQLFNSMDPSPFYEKDLDHDAEEFLVSWAHEYPRDDPLALVIHLDQPPASQEAQRLAEDAVRHYFADRARLNRLEFKRLMKDGRKSLVIGLFFLASCLLISELIALQTSGALWTVLREGLTIGGWVAMWKPLEIYLYEWWPLRRRGQIYEKMSRMRVEVRTRS